VPPLEKLDAPPELTDELPPFGAVALLCALAPPVEEVPPLADVPPLEKLDAPPELTDELPPFGAVALLCALAPPVPADEELRPPDALPPTFDGDVDAFSPELLHANRTREPKPITATRMGSSI